MFQVREEKKVHILPLKCYFFYVLDEKDKEKIYIEKYVI